MEHKNKKMEIDIQKLTYEEKQTMLNKLSESVISNQIALHFNEEIKFTKWYKAELKPALIRVLRILEGAEKREFDLIDEQQEKATTELLGVRNDAIRLLSELGLLCSEDILSLLKAYKKDPETIMLIADKVNK